MRPVKWNAFAPAFPLRLKEPRTFTYRTQRRAVRLLFRGFTQRPPTRRPAARRCTVKRTGDVTLSRNVTFVPVRRAARALGPLEAAGNTDGLRRRLLAAPSAAPGLPGAPVVNVESAPTVVSESLFATSR